MGREIRRVTPNWEHPKKERYDMRLGRYVEDYQPLFDKPFAPAMREWYAGWEAWERGERPQGAEDSSTFWDWDGGPPDPHYYRPAWAEGEATWWQVYETVSEGTPVTPPFATQEELIDYLASRGDFWDQKRGDGAWPRVNAEKFVKAGWAPSMVLTASGVHTARDGMPG